MHLSIRIATVAAVAAAFLAPAQAASAAELCGAVITAPGTTITLTEDLHCSDRGIVVRGDHVTIDLAGHTIFGRPGSSADPVLGVPAGVMLYYATNTVITGGTITGFSRGITAAHSTSTRVRDVTITGTFGDGMRLTDSSGIALESVTVTAPASDSWGATGIAAERVSGFSADGIIASHWPDSGMNLVLVNGISITRSSVTDNVGIGIDLWQLDGRVVIDDIVVARNGGGVDMSHSSRTGTVTISHSTFSDNVGNGLHTTNVTNARILDVTADDNGGEGIWMTSGIDATYRTLIPFVATIQGSTAKGNDHGGISMSDVGRWTLTGNRASSNGDSGFGLFGGTSILSGNTSTGNGDNGFTWFWDAQGTSTNDIATSNAQHGVFVDTRAKTRVRLENMSSTGNTLTGIQVRSGIAEAVGGFYASNRLDGLQAAGGALVAQRVTAIKNGRNGIAFFEGTSGGVDHVTSSKNGRYGICIAKAPLTFVSDLPPHVLLYNGVAPRGSQCVAIFLEPKFDFTFPIV